MWPSSFCRNERVSGTHQMGTLVGLWAGLNLPVNRKYLLDLKFSWQEYKTASWAVMACSSDSPIFRRDIAPWCCRLHCKTSKEPTDTDGKMSHTGICERDWEKKISLITETTAIENIYIYLWTWVFIVHTFFWILRHPQSLKVFYFSILPLSEGDCICIQWASAATPW